MVKCDFPGCENEPAMPFRCDRCNPPKYYCGEHRLPTSHDCLGKEEWRTTKSVVTEIAIGYERGSGARILAGSGHYSDVGRISTPITTSSIDQGAIPYSVSEKPKSWFVKLKEKISNIFK